jgi:hypothetical protein
MDLHKNIHLIDLAGATDISPTNLTTNPGITPVKKSSALNDLGLDAIAAFNNRSPEKWQGFAVGPQLTDGSYLLLSGTDNDFSETQNGSNTQFDVYFNPTPGPLPLLGELAALGWTRQLRRRLKG